ncbi:MAG: tungsten ABC transporter substrate-binding protein, partial [Synergistaceae bacterium]|nr:tungsten ABC transporter substrate-binding protein [Synergistaceae bacterium]
MIALALASASAAAPATQVLRMATTTSTDNTGLLDYLAPILKADIGIDLQWVAVG